MEITLAQAAEMCGGALSGDGSRKICGVCSPASPRTDMLCAAWDKRLVAGVPKDVPMLCGIGLLDGRDGIELKHPRAAMPALLRAFDRRRRPEPGIHSTAFIDEGCEIGKDVSIGPGCVVSRGASIGDGSILVSGVFIGEEASVGADCRFEPGVVVLDFVRVGDRVTLHAGVKVGCDGFGFIPTSDGKWEKMPQIGIVVIEDDVEIGANCSIDRAMFGETRIKRGTKIGSLTHVAHNCTIGSDCVMSGFSAMAGSVTIGDGCIIAGLVGIADHVSIGDRVTIAGRTGVTKDVPSGVTISGYPAQEHAKESRLAASLRRVPDMMARLKEVERAVEEMKAR